MKAQALVKLLTGLLLVVVFPFLTACRDGGEAATPTNRPTATPAPSPTPGERVEVRLVRVSDGDTIVVEIDGLEYRVRYLGMDTPETHHPDIGAGWLGQEATEANKALLAGGTVMLEKDITDADHYDRILRYVWVDGQMVQLELLRQGLARVGFYEPDVKYRQQFFAAEREAQQAKRGLWGPKPTPAPEQPFADGSTGWVVAPDDETTVGVWHDPAVDQPRSVYPVSAEVRLVAGFWVPWDTGSTGEGEEGRWWYWVALDEFRGWIAADNLTDVSPSAVAVPPPAPYVAYDWTSIAGGDAVVLLRAEPDAEGEITGRLEPSTRVQVTAVGWDADPASSTDQAGGQWWYYVETNTAADGWVLPAMLNWEDRTPG